MFPTRAFRGALAVPLLLSVFAGCGAEASESATPSPELPRNPESPLGGVWVRVDHATLAGMVVEISGAGEAMEGMIVFVPASAENPWTDIDGRKSRFPMGCLKHKVFRQHDGGRWSVLDRGEYGDYSESEIEQRGEDELIFRSRGTSRIQRWLRLESAKDVAHYWIGRFQLDLADGNVEHALRAWGQVDAGDAGDAERLNNFAWMLAIDEGASPVAREAAVVLAERAVALTNESESNSLDTLATALAASGEFERAVEVQERVVGMASNAGNRKRLELFKAGKPYFEK